MKKVGIVALVLVLLVSLGTTLAYGRAQKLDLRADPPWGSPPPAGPVAGFVIFNNDNDMDEVVVVVSLKDGAPNRTYGVYLEGYWGPTGPWKSWAKLGLLTTNRQGNGNFKARVSRDEDTYYLQVVVSWPDGTWGAGSFGTDIATVTIK